MTELNLSDLKKKNIEILSHFIIYPDMKNLISYKNKKHFVLCFLLFIAIGSARAQFEEQSSISFDSINSDALWGDYNNDGWLDVFVINKNGEGTSYGPTPNGLFENNGNESFSKLSYNQFVGIACFAIWGDFNNDNYLDIIASGDIWHGAHTGLYLNNGDKTFTSSFDFGTQGVAGERKYEIASGDFNNDGKLDVLYKDIDPSYSRPWKYVIFQNNGNGAFSQTLISFTDGSYNAGVCGDFNNDGYVDLILSKNGAVFYKNNGVGYFSEINQIGPYPKGRIGCADFNNDGYLDVTITYGDSSRIYKNNGNETFSESALIPFYGKSSFGDYNNDGYLDILMVNTTQSKIYKNNGDFTFTEVTNIALPGGAIGGAFGDYNNDGYLDIWINGKIFKNVDTLNIKKNTSPSAPSNPQQAIDFNSVTLKWDKASDVQSGIKGLSYNIRMGTKPGFADIVSSMSSIATGFRQLPTIGNAEYVTDGYQIRDLSPGTYYWSVQAIDNSWAGGTWGTESSFTITAIQASKLIANDINFNKLKLNWTIGNCSKRLVFMHENNTETKPMPGDGSSFIASDTFGKGTQIGVSGWYCVYNGSENEVTVINLLSNTTYKTVVYEYNGSFGNENYNTSINTSNSIIVTTKSLLRLQSVIPVRSGAATWGDFNNDGFLDVLLTDISSKNTTIHLYKNNGDSTFSEQISYVLDDIEWGCAKWVDTNNDGFLDIAMTGQINDSGTALVIYKNNADGTFSRETAKSNLKSIAYNEFGFGDFNNDGLDDLLIIGFSSDYNSAITYRNNGDGTFSEQTSFSMGVCYQSFCADFNNDSYVDIFLVSYFDSLNNYAGKMYYNSGNGQYTEYEVFQLNVDEINNMSMADYDSDGFLDIFIGSNLIFRNQGNGTFRSIYTNKYQDQKNMVMEDFDNDGYVDIFSTSSVFKNNKDNTFTDQKCAFSGSSVAVGDYNNDGFLDVLTTGYNTSIYCNNDCYLVNTPPSAPINLKQSFNLNETTLSWDKAADNQTPQDGLSYNVRIGNTKQGVNIVSPHANFTDGFRRIPYFGNAGLATKYKIKNLKAGTYYWSVQAIDNAFSGGPWAEEKTFTISDTITKIQNEIVKNIKFYPNPTKKYIRITLGKPESCKITIMNLNGRELLVQQVNSNDNVICLNELVSGLYLIKFQIKNDIVIDKLIIE